MYLGFSVFLVTYIGTTWCISNHTSSWLLRTRWTHVCFLFRRWNESSPEMFFLFVCLFFKYLFIYPFLAALGLSCVTWDLYLQHLGFLVAAYERLVAACMWDLVPWPGIEPGPPVFGERSPTHLTTREVPEMFSFQEVNKVLPFLVKLAFRWSVSLRCLSRLPANLQPTWPGTAPVKAANHLCVPELGYFSVLTLAAPQDLTQLTPPTLKPFILWEIGRASCRERV